MHDLSCETLITKYTLRGVPREPISATIAGMTAAELMLGATAAGTVIGAGGTLIGSQMKANAEEQMGQLQRRGAEFQAQQLDAAAGEARGAAQRQALEKQRIGRLALSSLRARAAQNEDSATSTDILKIGSDIAGRSEYEALGDLYAGENRARGLGDEATATRYSGAARAYGSQLSSQATRTGSYFESTGTILKGAGQFGKDYKSFYG